jgi:hypothetical protein
MSCCLEEAEGARWELASLREIINNLADCYAVGESKGDSTIHVSILCKESEHSGINMRMQTPHVVSYHK